MRMTGGDDEILLVTKDGMSIRFRQDNEMCIRDRLYAMHGLGLTADKPYRKSATVVGEVMGNYHPHGDAAIYDAPVSYTHLHFSVCFCFWEVCSWDTRLKTITITWHIMQPRFRCV